jgi:hypothetical protein
MTQHPHPPCPRCPTRPTCPRHHAVLGLLADAHRRPQASHGSVEPSVSVPVDLDLGRRSRWRGVIGESRCSASRGWPSASVGRRRGRRCWESLRPRIHPQGRREAIHGPRPLQARTDDRILDPRLPPPAPRGQLRENVLVTSQRRVLVRPVPALRWRRSGGRPHGPYQPQVRAPCALRDHAVDLRWGRSWGRSWGANHGVHHVQVRRPVPFVIMPLTCDGDVRGDAPAAGCWRG